MTGNDGAQHGGLTPCPRRLEGLEQLRAENCVLQEREQKAFGYVREKVNQLLQVMGTLPLRPEELDDRTLIDLDPVGIISDSFVQILEHLQSTNEELVLARDEIQAVFDSAGAAIVVVDREMRIQALNVRSRELFFPNDASVAGRAARPILCPEGQECVFDTVLATRQAAEQNDFVRNGRYFHVVGTPICHRGEDIAQVVLVYTDITTRKETEQALVESEERYRSLYSTMREGVALHQILYDDEGQPHDYEVLDVNPAFETIFGMSGNRVVGRRASEIFDTAPPYLDIYARVVRSGAPVTFEAIFAPVKKVFSVSAVSPTEGRFATIFEDITERKRAEDQIHRLAYFDSLTALPNRTLLKDRLDQAISQSSRNRLMVAVMFLDIDRFKGINDTLGHLQGDQLLKIVGMRLQECVRRSDTVARLGGDEFVIMLTGVANEQAVVHIAQSALDCLSQPVTLDGQEIYTTGSIGIALYPMDGADVDTLLKNADIAMYQAKELGRNTYQFYRTDMNAHTLEQLFLGNDLRRALEKGEFFLAYQPQVNLTTGRLIGVEALLRWEHSELGLVSPVQFIPLAEETGLIIPLGQWVLHSACAQAKAWQQAGFAPVRVAVNISACQFRQTDLVGVVKRILEETGLDAQWLELELTESVLMESADATKRILRELKHMGVSLAIDDFGTGYSSLNYLKHFPIDRLKIDRSFVNDININPDDAAIAEAIIALAHSLRLQVMAEGVENRDQVEFLHVRFCEEMQGFYFSQPLSAECLANLLCQGLAVEDFTFEAGLTAGTIG